MLLLSLSSVCLANIIFLAYLLLHSTKKHLKNQPTSCYNPLNVDVGFDKITYVGETLIRENFLLYWYKF